MVGPVIDQNGVTMREFGQQTFPLEQPQSPDTPPDERSQELQQITG